MVLKASTTSEMDPSTKPKERWSGIIGTGQSLSVGFQAWLNNTTDTAPGGLRLEDTENKYDTSDPHALSLKLAPFKEPFRPLTQFPDTYPGNINGKTPQHSMVRQIAMLCEEAGIPVPVTVHTCVGKNGAPLFEIRKEGTRNAYEASIYEAKALTHLAKQHNAELHYDAIVLTHGETDALLGHETYAEELLNFYEDYVTDTRNVTGQPKTRPVLIQSQQQSFPTLLNIQSQLIHDQWWVQRMDPHGRVFCAGPKYQYGYAPGGVHLPLAGYDRLGEKYGQVYFQTVIKNEPWQPLAPSGVFLQGDRDIVVSFELAHPPLQWDAHLPRPHQSKHVAWREGKGFEVRNTSGEELEIASAEILDGGERVAVRLARPARRGEMPLQLAYAMLPDFEGGGAAGEPDGRMGLLCDSDPVKSAGAETKVVEVRTGEREIRCAAGWENQAAYDSLVDEATGEQYVLSWVLEEDKTRAVLNKGWRGPFANDAKVTCAHNQLNYCVTFALPVAYKFGTHEGGPEEITKEQLEKWRGFQVNFPDECRKKCTF